MFFPHRTIDNVFGITIIFVRVFNPVSAGICHEITINKQDRNLFIEAQMAEATEQATQEQATSAVTTTQTFETDDPTSIDNKIDLQFPLEDVGDYGGYMVFTTLEDKPQDIAGLLSGAFNSLGTIFSRTEKFDDTGDQNPKDANEQADRQKEIKEAEETLNTGFNTKLSSFDDLSNMTPLRKVKLFLPQGIQIADGVQYAGADLGAIGGAVVGALASGQGAAGGLAQGIAGGINSFVESLSGTASSDAAKLAMVRASAALGTTGQNAVKAVSRVTLNPNTRQLFESVNTREFSFTFKMIPQSQKEAREIKEIIKLFRTELYPEKLRAKGKEDTGSTFSLGYKFPNRFLIEFFYKEQAIATKILPSFLRNITVTYNPTSMGMHADGNFQETEVTLNFVESRTLSKDDIKEGY